MLSRRVARAFVLAESAVTLAGAQQRPRPEANDAITILKPARVFDGETMHEGWAVRVKGERIDAAGAPFDPELHDAVLHEDGDGAAEVIEVWRSGWRWTGRVLRAALVTQTGDWGCRAPGPATPRAG